MANQNPSESEIHERTDLERANTLNLSFEQYLRGRWKRAGRT